MAANTLTSQQIADAAALASAVLFEGRLPAFISASIATANVNWVDVQAAVSQIDQDLNTTLNAAVAAFGGTTTVLNALNASLPSPVSGLTAQQKTVILCLTVLKRAGLI